VVRAIASLDALEAPSSVGVRACLIAIWCRAEFTGGNRCGWAGRPPRRESAGQPKRPTDSIGDAVSSHEASLEQLPNYAFSDDRIYSSQGLDSRFRAAAFFGMSEDSIPRLRSGPFGHRVRVPKAAELVAQHLRRQIVRGELAEGDALPSESVLMDEFVVSRPTLREAFRILESENLVSVRRGARGGARVHPPDGKVAARYAGLILEHRGATLADVYEARRVIEVEAARTLAERRELSDIAKLRNVAAEAQLSVDGIRGVNVSALGFHQLMVQLTGNETMAVLSEIINNILVLAADSFTAYPRNTEQDVARVREEHLQLVELIEAKQADEAASFWSEHCTSWADLVLRGPGAKSVLDLLT
jgi:DNA-binding FadR family transcriptional regulator